MSLDLATTRLVSFGLLGALLSGCFHPPYNNFKPDSPVARSTAAGAGVGAVVGVVTSATLTGTLIGGAAGGAVGGLMGLRKESKPYIIKQLQKRDIQFEEYGDTMTLIVPTDKYFMFNSPRLNELCYPGLVHIVKLLKLYPKSPIFVAGFTDNVGSRRHKQRLSQAQAETMLTYLWANNIPARHLTAEGYGDKNAIGNNKIMHGSAYNRRVEIQWLRGVAIPAPIVHLTK